MEPGRRRNQDPGGWFRLLEAARTTVHSATGPETKREQVGILQFESQTDWLFGDGTDLGVTLPRDAPFQGIAEDLVAFLEGESGKRLPVNSLEFDTEVAGSRGRVIQ